MHQPENPPENSRDWKTTALALTHPRVITMLFLGFSAGLPLWLIFSSLSLWLGEAGVNRGVVTMFSWAALGYSFKFVWAPLVDSLAIPLLTAWLGRRRSWMLVAQLLVASAMVAMALQDPARGQSALVWLALATVMLGFSAATQDIVIDAFRIESAAPDLQAMLSATYIVGYRVGMVLSGAGALYLASWFGSSAETYSYLAWQKTYLVMAAAMLIGITTTLLVAEPKSGIKAVFSSTRQNLRIVGLFLSAVAAFITAYLITRPLAGMLEPWLAQAFANRVLASVMFETLRLATAIVTAFGVLQGLIKLQVAEPEVVNRLYIEPVKEFFQRYRLRTAIVILLLVGLYRISDIVMGVIANLFYQDLGYSKNEIATVSKVFGVIMSIVGGLTGGMLAFRFGVLRILMLGAILAAATNLLFMLLAQTGYNPLALWAVIGADNISGGIASAAFVAFLSALTNIRFTAMQYAIFTSLMTLLPKILGGYSGGMVNAVGYPQFFLMTALLGVPVIFLIILVTQDSQVKVSDNFRLANS